MPKDKMSLFESIGQAFGFVQKKKSETTLTSIVPKRDVYDGAIEIASTGGIVGHNLNLDTKIGGDFETISKYREMALQPEIDFAINDIINESIVIDNKNEPVELDLEQVEFSDKIKNSILDEFSYILKLFNFNNRGHEIFRQWYVDGRLYYHTIIDEKNPKKGILEVRNIDPRKIKKMLEVKKEQDPFITGTEEYFVYSPVGFGETNSNSFNTSIPSIRLSSDIIAYVTSGLLDGNNVMVLSYLQKALKPLNQLRMLEDSVVIYRLARAPERRIFYVDVGNLPKQKAEEHLQAVQNRFKNKLSYNVQTGEMIDDKRHMSMLEDIWMPRREGGKGTEVSILAGGQQSLSALDDVEYFRKRLMKSLNVPYSRLDDANQWTLGRATEITRDEVRFNRFIGRLRNKFTDLFDYMLEKQLVLKGIITKEDWANIKQDIKYQFNQDSYFAEMKEIEVLKERFNLLTMVDPFTSNGMAGDQKRPYLSQEWVAKNILQQNEENYKSMTKEIDKEVAEVKKNAPPETGDSDGSGGIETPPPETEEPNRVELPPSDEK